MLIDLIKSGFDRGLLIEILLAIPVILFSLTFHEVAHGYIACKLGDPTARNFGRLTLNPAKHLDPLGTILMLTVGYGWAKPVPVNSRYFRDPKKGMAFTALAGPVSNLVLALISVAIYSLMIALLDVEAVTRLLISHQTLFNLYSAVYSMFRLCAYLNVSLAVFNLIPLPPFDGSRIFYAVLPAKLYFSVMKYERYILIVFLALLYTGIVSLPISYITNWIITLFDFIFGLIFGIGG